VPEEIINPVTVADMTQAELEALVMAIRERRDRVARIRTAVVRRSRETPDGDYSVKLERIAKKMTANIEKIDKLRATLEVQVAQYVTLRLAKGDMDGLQDEVRVLPTEDDTGDDQ
jgi:uncharacterized membrane protein